MNNRELVQQESEIKRVNDKGDEVPDKCDQCGSKVGLFFKGEPVWLCSNKDCGKYFGTLPCTIQEVATDNSKWYHNDLMDETFYRIEYKGIGIYEALHETMSVDEWRDFKQSDAATWLPVPPNYQPGDKSFFTKKGYNKFMELTYPYVLRYLDESNVLKFECELNPIYIRYMDEYQVVSNKTKRIKESTLPDGVFLRPANESDLPNIIKWKLESVNPKTRNDPKTIRFIENDAKENLKDTKMIMSYSTVIGVLESCYIDDGEWWYIGEIYLIPEYRGKGIARVILQQEIDSHDKLKLRVSKDNTHAIDLYKSLGFGISEEDEYAYTMTLVKNETIQEGAWNDIRNGVNPKSKKLFFHISMDSKMSRGVQHMCDLIEEINSIRYDSGMYVLEAYDDYLTKNILMITEAKTFNANDKLLVSKIIDGFRKALNAVKRFISNIINKIKSLFKKNSDKNINNIAQEILGDIDTVVTESVYVEGVQKGTDYITSHGRTPEQFSDDIYLQILNDDVIRIHYRQGRQLNRPDIESSKDLKNVNKFKSGSDDIIGDVIHMITHLDLLQDLYSKMSKFINVLNKTTESTPELDKCHDELKESFKQLDRAKHKISIGLNPRVDLKVSDLLETQSVISKLTVESEKLNYNDYDTTWYSKYINILGNISHKFIKFQMCLNAFSNKLDFDINFIAPQYRGKIKDPLMLAKFVKGCIDKGISPKYLSYNTWLISSKKIKGDTKHFDPIKGQSRFVLFPEDSKIVYKIAMSGFGIAANNNEYKITNLVKDKPETKDYFALIINNYEDGAIVEQERVVNNLKDAGLSSEVYENSLNVFYDKSESTADIEEDIGVIQRDLGIKTPISLDDLHSGNKSIDTNRGHLVLIDYGMLHANYDRSGVQRMSPERYDLLKEERRMDKDYKSGKIPKDEYESWKADAKKRAWSMRNIEDLTDFEIVNKRNSLIKQLKNETDPKKKHDLKKQIDELQKELHMRDSNIDSHVHGATVTNKGV